LIVFDLSSLVRWSGPAVGIMRVQQKLAEYARHHLDDVTFTVFDPEIDCWRVIKPEWIDPIIAGHATVDMSLLPDPSGAKRRIQDTLPAPLRGAFYWVTQSRRKTLEALEGLRLTAASPRLRRTAEHAAERLLTPKHRSRFYDGDGRRRMVPPFRLIAGSALQPGSGDTTLAVQCDWSHTNIRAIAELKRKRNFRHVVLCYDIIPILHPEWYKAHDVASFTAYYDQVLPLADRIIFNSRRIREDVIAYASGRGVILADTRVVPLGSDPVQARDYGKPLPEPLSAGRYILFVATIEPRKNHRMLYAIWKRLLADGLPQQTGFKLVFVGRPGWMMDDFYPLLKADRAVAETLIHYVEVDDATLAALYRNAAFCVYPSIYEGYGLPPVEALAHGTPLIASTGGAVPEIVQDFGVCIDPSDEVAWEKHIRHWMTDEGARNAFAAAARHRFHPVSWDEASAAFFANVR
jgi:glycosyltransferase involved in cell wall biosynthesis